MTGSCCVPAATHTATPSVPHWEAPAAFTRWAKMLKSAPLGTLQAAIVPPAPSGTVASISRSSPAAHSGAPFAAQPVPNCRGSWTKLAAMVWFDETAAKV